MEYSRFAVDTRPYCVWDPELRAQERDFVQRLDPSYFEFLAAAYASQQGEPGPAESDDAAEVPMHAALALRTAYVHAAETLLALLFGAVQAPDCLLGWMHLYQPVDLRSMINKIDGYERFPTRLNATRVTWEEIAEAVFSPLVLDDKEKEARIERNFADLWRHIAREWARADTASEYNSVKHGLRIHAGGFRLAVGIEDRPGERADPARMRSFGGSRYGSSYYELRQIMGRRHRGVTRSSRNWRVDEAYVGLTLIAQSIANLRAWLLIAVHGVDANSLQFVWPNSDEPFALMKEPVDGPISFNTSSIVYPEDIRDLSAEEILAVYNRDARDP